MRTSLVIPLSIILGGLIVAGAVYIAMPKNPKNTGNPALILPVTPSDHILGNPAAKVMIVEYSDFDCEYCKAFDTTMHQLMANEGVNGNVAWVFRHFPLSEIHKDALALAQASECAAQAGGNDAFWSFEETLFRNQPADPTKLGPVAAEARVPGAAFASCYATASTTYTTEIMDERQNAFDIGATGTPYSVIVVAGKPPVIMDGAYTYDALKQLVDEALAN